MTVVNQAIRLENAVPPKEIMAFRGAYPHILDALIANQTLINQLIIRSGGSGSGSNITDLSELSARIEENAGQIAAVMANARNTQDPADSIADSMGVISKKFTREEIAFDELKAMIGRVSTMQSIIMQRVEELEALCLSSLAR